MAFNEEEPPQTLPRGQYITWLSKSTNTQMSKLYPVVHMLLRLGVVKPVHSVAAQIVVESLFFVATFCCSDDLPAEVICEGCRHVNLPGGQF